MELKQLESFVRVSELGSFTKASIALAVAQPVLSKQVRRLEVELRQTLFARTGRGIVLTDEGRILFEHAKGILDQVDRARDAINAARDSAVGRVVIATPFVSGDALTVGFFNAFRTTFPKASLEIIEGKSRFIHEWLLTGRIDIGILYDPPQSPLLESSALAKHKLSLFSLPARSWVPKSRPVPFRSLEKLPLILPGHPHAIRTLVDAEAAKAGFKLNVVLQVDGASFMLELVRLGHGYTILPDFSRQRRGFSRDLQVNEIVKPHLLRTLKVAISLKRPVTRLARQTVKLIHKHLGDASDPATKQPVLRDR